jgi:ABC-type nitrate/sulfonate/bicarbonate transport system permease component
VSALKGAVVPLAALVVWEAGARYFGIASDTLSAPSAIFKALVAGFADGSLVGATVETLLAAAGGLAVGAGLGLAAGIVLGLFPAVSKLSLLTVEFLRPVPAIALVPICLLIFGFGYPLEIAVVGFACFFPILVLTEQAIAQLPRGLFEVSTVLRLGFIGNLVKIVLPACLPRIFVAFRLAAGIALIVAITVEIVANPMGLGSRLMRAAQSLRPADMFATLFWVGMVGWMTNALLVAVEKRFFGHYATVGTTT